jgi:hypothetical protein
MEKYYGSFQFLKAGVVTEHALNKNFLVDVYSYPFNVLQQDQRILTKM